jgi:predicted unusual protein kinase regulating ubiquinone biosynthesis (AarF/ABC1/UbiB family)
VKHRHLVGGTDAGAAASADPEVAANAQALAEDLEGLGPTYVKLGQLLSTRADLLPAPYLEALTRLQDKVEPFPFEEVEHIVEREIGARVSKAFRSLDHRPLAAASLGQVHRAELRDGRAVVVKVQRPGIREQILEDMAAIREIAELADRHSEAGRRLGFGDMVAEFQVSLLRELDYRQEASNLVAVGTHLADHELIVVPQPVLDYSSDLVLTMDHVSGTSISAAGPLRLMEVDGPALARALFRAYLDQILVHGLVHADPHPGNVLLTDDGRLGLIDLGMTVRITPEMQDHLVVLLLAIGDRRGRDAADVAIAIGRPLDDFDPEQFRQGAAELVGGMAAEVGELQAGTLVAELIQMAGASGLRLPSELTMLGKALLNLDEIVRRLDPTFSPDEAIRDETAELMRKKLLQAASPGNVLSAAMQAKELAERLPGRIGQVLDALAEGEFTINVQGIDERNLMRGVQKLANRVAAAVVVAALVIGAALIMRIETDAELLGYPAVAIVLFLLAALGGLLLLGSILLSDLPQRRRRGRR